MDTFSKSMSMSNSISKMKKLIINLLLGFHRLIGVTFGGLAVNTNGRLTVNDGIKFYGFFVSVVILIMEICHYVCLFVVHRNMSLEHEKLTLDEIPDSLRKTTWMVFVIYSMWFDSIKITTLVYFNTSGQYLLKFVFDNIKLLKNTIVTQLLLVFWLTKVIIFTVVSKMSLKEIDSMEKVCSLLDYSLCCIYSATLIVMVWIVSIQMKDKLNNIKYNLEIIVNGNIN